MSEGSNYMARVDYRYSVSGKSFQGDRIAFGYLGSSWQGPNQEIADRLSAGKTVLVRYDPEKPTMAVLSWGLNGSTAVRMFVGGWVILVAAIMVLYTLRPRSTAGMLSLSRGSYRFEVAVRGVGGIALLIVTGLVLAWIGGLLSDCGILGTLVTT